eukprot:5835480-Ditylum_brightwellii.AAC.1
MPGEEALAAEKRMALLLAQSMQREYSEICGFVRQRMALALARSNTLLLHGARDHSNQLRRRPDMEDGAGIELLRPRQDD